MPKIVDIRGREVLDSRGNPTVEVDDKDQQITFHEPDVKDFIKPDTKLIYQNEELHKIIR